jgi:predicted NBD/HSP70 family sugar kinase
VALTDLTGSRILDPVVVATPTVQSELIQTVRDALDAAHVRFGSRVSDMRTVTLAVPGGVTGKDSTIALSSTVPALEGLHVTEFLGVDEGTIVRVENDANLAALGEGWRGAAAGSRDFAAMYLGVGVGMGIVSDGRLLRGAHGLAGEIAFLPIGADPGKGAAYTGGAFEAAITAAQASKATAALVPLVAQAALSIQATLDPELIVIGGPQAQDPALIGEIRAALSQITALKLNIVMSVLGKEAVLVGAVADARSSLLESVLG